MTTAPRCGDGAVACGNAIAATNSAWNCGSVAVSIFTTARAALSISSRACIDSNARTAPAPAALPTERTASTGAVGNEAEHERVERVDVSTERAGQPHVVQRLDAGVAHQQVDAGTQRSLRQLDGPHVVLGDRQLGRLGAVEHVAERAIVGDDVRARVDHLAADHTLTIDDASRGTSRR